MKNKVRGGAFRLTGLILGIIGATVSITAIVFSAVGLHQSHLCKKCEKGAAFKEPHRGSNGELKYEWRRGLCLYKTEYENPDGEYFARTREDFYGNFEPSKLD